MTCSFFLFVLMKINIALHASKDSLLSDDPPKYSLADFSTTYDPCTLLPLTPASQTPASSAPSHSPPATPPKLRVEIPNSQIFTPKPRLRTCQNLAQQQSHQQSHPPSQKEERERRRRRAEKEKEKEKEKGKSREVRSGGERERWRDRKLDGLKRLSRGGPTGAGAGWMEV